MIIVTGSILAKPDNFDELRELSLEHVRRSRLESGCLSHTVSQSVEDPLRLVFFETWADRAALAAHFAVPASGEFARIAGERAAEPTVIHVYEAERIN